MRLRLNGFRSVYFLLALQSAVRVSAAKNHLRLPLHCIYSYVFLFVLLLKTIMVMFDVFMNVFKTGFNVII